MRERWVAGRLMQLRRSSASFRRALPSMPSARSLVRLESFSSMERRRPRVPPRCPMVNRLRTATPHLSIPAESHALRPKHVPPILHFTPGSTHDLGMDSWVEGDVDRTCFMTHSRSSVDPVRYDLGDVSHVWIGESRPALVNHGRVEAIDRLGASGRNLYVPNHMGLEGIRLHATHAPRICSANSF